MTDRSQATEPARTLYVDLDGTLIATDLLWEALFRLAQTRPWDLLRLPGWLLLGKAAFKRRVAERVVVDPEGLPYRAEVLVWVRAARARGDRVVLATASDVLLAAPVAGHLAAFDAVLASDGATNLSGAAKLRAIERDAGGDFDYLGNDRADLTVLERARRAVLVAPDRRAARQAARLSVPVELLGAERRFGRSAWHALRPHQWVKNVLLFVPLVLAHAVTDPGRWVATLAAFAGFCACASGTYLLNDLFDLAADRRHPHKRNRPLASGDLPIPTGAALGVGLLVAGVGGALALAGTGVAAMLAGYVVLTTLYSLYLKQVMVLDVLLLAGLFAYRVLTGAVAADVPLSPWLLVFSMFFFLSLAAVKRYTELIAARGRAFSSIARRGYDVEDAELVQVTGIASGYLGVLVIGLYVSSEDVLRLYPRAEVLWLVCPLLLYWITRVWFLARRGRVSEDPVIFAVRDPVSWAVGAMVVLCGAAATWAGGGRG